ncbi:MAG: cytochrome P450 [Actinomycetota bacterium]|nr:cytochrome P450 [Actinomycetota bacterium]
MADDYHQLRDAAPPAPLGCPVNHEWSPLNEDYLVDPYPIASALRADGPMFYAEQLGYVVITEMVDILDVFNQPEVYSSEIVQDPVFPLGEQARAVLAAPDFNPQKVMSNRQAPDHGRIRKYTRQGFSRRRLQTLEPYVRRRSGELIDDMIASKAATGEPIEFIDAFAFPLPGETVFRFIGFPEADDERLKHWCADRKAFSWGRPSEDEQAVIAEKMLAYWRYCRAFTATKQANRGDDFASELLAAHEADATDLTYREVESILYGLSFAGHEAVTALICNCLLCLLPRRDQWDQLVADPSLIPNAVEEVLRFESSQISWRRVTTRETELRGVSLPAGTRIFMNFASANRQADLFDHPDEFDIHRPNAAQHISFGKGMHYCLGANLAKFEAVLVLEALVDRLPSLRMVEDQKIWSSPNITFRGPEQLLVDF